MPMRYWIPATYILLAVFVLLNFAPFALSAREIFPAIQPAFHTVLIGFLIIAMPRRTIVGQMRRISNVAFVALVCVLLYTALRWSIAYLLPISTINPDKPTVVAFITVLAPLLLVLIAKELIRNQALANAAFSTRRTPVFVGITLMMTFIDMNLIQTMDALGGMKAVDGMTMPMYIIQDVMPLLAQNIFLSSIVMAGGAWPGILYSVSLVILNNPFFAQLELPGMTESALGITLPILAALFVAQPLQRRPRVRRQRRARLVVLGSSLFLAVLGIWFVVGVFPLYPAVTKYDSKTTGLYAGDVLLIDKINNESQLSALTEQDIIHYTKDGILKTERISKIFLDESGIVRFQTLENSLSAPDSLIEPKQIIGKITSTIPKIGAPVIWLQSSVH